MVIRGNKLQTRNFYVTYERIDVQVAQAQYNILLTLRGTRGGGGVRQVFLHFFQGEFFFI